jgi:cell division protein FtsL
MVPMGDDSNKDEPHISWTVFFAVLVVCLVLVIVLPALGVMYMDMNNATIVANEEIRKMKELRLKLLTEMQGQ